MQAKPCNGQMTSAPATASCEENSPPAPNDEEARWWLHVSVGGFRVRALYDTGMARTVMGSIGLQLATDCRSPLMPSYGRKEKVPGGHTVAIAGYVLLPFEVAGVKKEIRVAVLVNETLECYLGSDFIRTFGMIHDSVKNQLTVSSSGQTVELEVASVAIGETLHLASIGLDEMTEVQKKQLQELLDNLLVKTDEPLGRTAWAEHGISVGSARPIKQKYYPVSKKLEETMHAQVREMLEAGIIEPSTSAWSSPVVMVRKALDKYRFCIDFRKINAVSRADAYPLPYMDALLRKLQGAKYIPTLDLSSAYHQIPLKEESRSLTAFTVPGLGLFQFTRMPYGLSQAGATFQRLIDQVIGPKMEPYTFSYLDDIIIVTETFEEHVKWLSHVLK